MTNEKEFKIDYSRLSLMIKELNVEADFTKRGKADRYSYLELEQLLSISIPIMQKNNFSFAEEYEVSIIDEDKYLLYILVQLRDDITGLIIPNRSSVYREIFIKSEEEKKALKQNEKLSFAQRLVAVESYYRRCAKMKVLDVCGEKDIDGNLRLINDKEIAELINYIKWNAYLLNSIVLDEFEKNQDIYKNITLDHLIKKFGKSNAKELSNKDYLTVIDVLKNRNEFYLNKLTDNKNNNKEISKSPNIQGIEKEGAKNWKHQQVTSLGTN